MTECFHGKRETFLENRELPLWKLDKLTRVMFHISFELRVIHASLHLVHIVLFELLMCFHDFSGTIAVTQIVMAEKVFFKNNFGELCDLENIVTRFMLRVYLKNIV